MRGKNVYAQKVVVKPYNKNLNSCIFDLSGFLHNILSIYKYPFLKVPTEWGPIR